MGEHSLLHIKRGRTTYIRELPLYLDLWDNDNLLLQARFYLFYLFNFNITLTEIGDGLATFFPQEWRRCLRKMIMGSWVSRRGRRSLPVNFWLLLS